MTFDKMWKRAASLRQALDLLGVHHLPKEDQEFLEELCNPYVGASQPADAKDAARYRWLRDSDNDWATIGCQVAHENGTGKEVLGHYVRESLDAAIDAAMQQEQDK